MNFSERFNARHARKTDDVVGFQAGQCRRGHFRKGCVARVLHHGDALLCLSADRPTAPSPSVAARMAPIALGPQQRPVDRNSGSRIGVVFTRPEALWAYTLVNRGAHSSSRRLFWIVQAGKCR